VHPVVQVDPKAPERLPLAQEKVAVPTDGAAPLTVTLEPSAMVVPPEAEQVLAPTVHVTVGGSVQELPVVVADTVPDWDD
jgi:hypothetical protein